VGQQPPGLAADDGPKVNAESFNIALACCVAHPRSDKAEQQLQRMERAGHRPDITTDHTHLMDVYTAAGDHWRVLYTLLHLEVEGMSPGVHAYNTAIASCAAMGRAGDAEGLLDAHAGGGRYSGDCTAALRI
jgi:pentatricopeptide repeat protein